MPYGDREYDRAVLNDLRQANARLRAEVARLTLARDTAVNSFTFNYKRANDAEAERNALRTLVAQLVGALRGLEGNVSGLLALGGAHVAEVVGYTNVACVKHWQEQARAALAAAAPYLPRA